MFMLGFEPGVFRIEGVGRHRCSNLFGMYGSRPIVWELLGFMVDGVQSSEATEEEHFLFRVSHFPDTRTRIAGYWRS
jgi:hypothetical protein